MKSSIKIAWSIVALLALASNMVVAQIFYIELDLDGVVGNGPDLLQAAVSDYVTVDVWCMGDDAPLAAWGIGVCNLDGFLEVSGVDLSFPEGSSVSGPIYPGGACVAFCGFNLANWLYPPYKVATITYRAAVDNSLADLTNDLDPTIAFWNGTGFNDGVWDPYLCVDATIRIGFSTDVDQGSWGSIKGLFK